MSSLLSTLFGLKEEKQEEPQTHPSTNKPYHPFPELSGKEKMEAVEKRLIQKFREGMIEGADLRVGDVSDDLKWLYEVMNYGAENSNVSDINKWRRSAYYILKKDPELWKKVEQDAKVRIENNKFNFQEKYIQISREREALDIYKSLYLPTFPDFARFTVLTLDEEEGEIKTKFTEKDYRTYKDLEFCLLREGYKFIREDNGYLIYWKG